MFIGVERPQLSREKKGRDGVGTSTHFKKESLQKNGVESWEFNQGVNEQKGLPVGIAELGSVEKGARGHQEKYYHIKSKKENSQHLKKAITWQRKVMVTKGRSSYYGQCVSPV